MPKGLKILLAAGALITVLWLGILAVAAAVVYETGTLVVSVHEKEAGGADFTLPIPVALVRAGLSFVPAEDLRDMDEELAKWQPAIQAAVAELSRCPDGPLVEVQSTDENVRIVKKGSKLVIEVDDADATVHLSVPLSGLASLLAGLSGNGSGEGI